MHKSQKLKPSQILEQTKIRPVKASSGWVERDSHGIRACAVSALLLSTGKYTVDKHDDLTTKDGRRIFISDTAAKEFGLTQDQVSITSMEFIGCAIERNIRGKRATKADFKKSIAYLKSIGK